MATQHIVSPVDGRVYSTIDVLTDGDADALLRSARHVQPGWADAGLEARIELCRRFVAAMMSRKARIADELTWQMGRPIAFTPKEVDRLAERANAMIGAAGRGLAPLDLSHDGTKRWIDRVPHGVCLVVAPWNYPYLTAVNTIVPALLAGNSVILKPATQTHLTGDRFADAFREAGIPEGVFTSAALSHETIARWVSMRHVDFVAFTGSVRGGAEIERAGAGKFLPVALELGGKDPAYVHADADLDFAANELVDGSFFNSGQSCCGIERIYVDRRVCQPFLDRFVDITARTQKLGTPTDSGVTLGPVVSDSAAQGIRRQVADAVAMGAAVVAGERGAPGTSAYMPATILTNVTHDMDVMREETFGPVVGIMPVDGDDHAVQFMNDSCYGLSASIWTSDREAGANIGRRVEAGTLFVNRCDYLDPGLAWVGIKDSGRDCSLSELGFHHVTRPKSYYVG